MRAAGREYWEGMLKKHGNNISAAAREAGVHRQDVYRFIKRYGVAYRPHRGAWDRGPDPIPNWPRGKRELRL
jgi:DNA-binding NtrC family response regulator